MAIPPPDPHVRTKRTPLLIGLVVAIIAIGAATAFFAQKPGAGMGGSLSSGPEQSQR